MVFGITEGSVWTSFLYFDDILSCPVFPETLQYDFYLSSYSLGVIQRWGHVTPLWLLVLMVTCVDNIVDAVVWFQ